MLDLHRHDEYSTFDGYGNATELALLAKQKGYSALGTSNHGNTNGLVRHYNACKAAEITPVLGVEGYFQPKIDKEKPRYHICLFAKNAIGYGNLNRLMYIGEQQKYYNPIVTFKDLREHSEGIICTSACIAGFVPQMLKQGKVEIAKKALNQFVDIFGDDFYIEVQPYKIDEEGTQERVNLELMELAEELGIQCVLTSDSHYGDKEEFNTYKKMHEIADHKYDIELTYGERYMPDYDELYKRFVKMHGAKFGKEMAKNLAQQMYDNLEEIETKVEPDFLQELPMELPEFIEGKDSYELLEKAVKKGIKERGFSGDKEYINRCKTELSIIKGHGFSDYFLMVQDYVLWAKSRGIRVGPGRGSVCNCLVAYMLGITEVDSIYFNLDFRRFLREDKKKMPDIDLDFETSRRKEVIEYLVDRYKGHAAQICSYGLYKLDNLINDLMKACNVEATEKKHIKSLITRFLDDDTKEINKEGLLKSKEAIQLNKDYDNFILHFVRLYKKVRFIGTHAAGVAITGGQLLDYTALRVDSKTGKTFTNYDLGDLEQINVTKFDILGLTTMESLRELEDMTGVTCDYREITQDEQIIEAFSKGDTDGVFQFEKKVAKDILVNIQTDCFEDVIAASSMNRPGPLSLGMPQMYAENKENMRVAKQSKYYKYAEESYGTLIYQEQIQQICIHIGELSWPDADKIMKFLKGGNMSEKAMKGMAKNKEELREKFLKGAVKNGMSKQEADEVFEKMFVYSFNKGHAAGYTLISAEEMFYKIYHPTEFWYVKMKYASDDNAYKYSACAAKDGVVIFLPHVNYTNNYSLRKVDGERVIQQGLIAIKGVGEKAALFIEEEKRNGGLFQSYEDFIERCQKKGSPVNKGVIEKLKESGALEFNKRIYISRVTKYNATLYMKGLS